MSQQLILELSDEIYADLQQKANDVGLSVTDLIIATLTKQDSFINSAVGSQEQQEEARQRFWSHAGAISLGYATGVDNESIDADIAKAYADEY
jgi:hypothetical protein